MSSSVKVLHLTVIGPFVGHVKCRGDGAPVGIHTTLFE